MKKALVTGSAGFIGRHMSRRLEVDGWSVVGVDLDFVPSYYSNGGNLQLDALEFFRRADTHYDLVVHCAFHVGGRAAIDSKHGLFAKNLELDAAMFDWAVRTKQRRVVYYSSSAAYPVDLQSDLALPRQLREDDVRLGAPFRNIGVPDAAYGWAKLTGEKLAHAASLQGVNVHVLRPFSGYGADQSLDYPFPAIVQRARQHVGGEFTVWGPPGQTRDWIHVDDVVAGTLAVVENDERRPVNLCTGLGTEFGELARMVLSAAGKLGLAEVVYDTTKPTGVAHRVGDPTRVHRHYVPKISIQEGIHRALAD